MSKDTGVYSSRNPTELPDFVQDHLVIEQCYLNHTEPVQQVLVDVDNLPDFALNSRQARLRNEPNKRDDSNVLCDLPFDLTGMLDKGLSHRNHSVSNAMHSNHLDLPTFERPTSVPVHRPQPTGICMFSILTYISILFSRAYEDRDQFLLQGFHLTYLYPFPMNLILI